MDLETTTVGQNVPRPWIVWVLVAASAPLAAWFFVMAKPESCAAKWTPYLLAKLLLISPLLEEAAFRGGLQSILLAKWSARINRFGISLANLLTSLGFAATHVFFGTWVGATVFIPSLVLGFVFERYGKLWPCILLHAGFNIAFVSACAWR